MRDVGAAGARVLERVGQPLLDDPVRGEVDRAPAARPARRRPAAATGSPARRTCSSSGRARPARAAARASAVVLAPQRAEQQPHLAERGAAGLLDAAQRLAVLGDVGQPVADRADLQHHDADRVGDDVVQLARDPRALLGDRDARRRLALALRLAARSSAASACVGALAQREPGEPGEHEHGRQQHDVARRVQRVVDHDDRGAADDDHQPDPALALVAQAAEQERGGHARRRMTPAASEISPPSTNDSAAASSHSDGRRGERRARGARAAAARAARAPARRPRGGSVERRRAQRPPRARRRPRRSRSAGRSRVAGSKLTTNVPPTGPPPPP